MSKIILLFCCFEISLQPFVLAQNSTDSLLFVLKSEKRNENKIALLRKVSIRFSNQRKTSVARKYADTLLTLSQNLKDEKGKKYAAYCYGLADRFEGNYSNALIHLDEYNQYFQKTGDSIKLADGLFQCAVVYRLTGDYKKSLVYFYRILKIGETDHNPSGIANTLNSIAIIYRSLQQYDQAVENYKKAIDVFRGLHDPRNEAMCNTNLGNLYAERKQYAQAKFYYEKSLELLKNTKLHENIGYAYANLGIMCREMGDYAQALNFHLKSLSIREKLPMKEELAFTYQELGATYLKLKNYKAASKYLQNGLEIANKINAKPLIVEIYSVLADLEVEMKDYQKAYTYHKLYSSLNDSVLNKETKFQILELKTKYETAEKDKQIILLAKEKEIHQQEAKHQAVLKMIFIAGFALISLLAVLLFYIYRQRLKSQTILAQKNAEIKDINFQRQLGQLEMKSLRAQINPHFLFNCMNSINSMILKGENNEASQYLTKFSKLIRLILENAEANNVPLENELALLESYIQLEKLRFKGQINYHIAVENNVDPEEACIPSMILQPFVENSIWHGLLHKTKPEEGLVDISVKEQDGRIVCTIQDNGVGREKSRELHEKTVYKTKSMGIKITEERLRLLSKEYPNEVIKITDLKDSLNNPLGTRVEINIPVTG